MLELDLSADPCGTLFITSVQKLKAVLIFSFASYKLCDSKVFLISLYQ